MTLRPVEYHRLPDAVANDEQHYANLNHYRTMSLPAITCVGKFWQIDARTYEYFLGMLPPVYVPGGFRMIELTVNDVACHFFQFGDVYWCGFTHCTRENAHHMLTHIRGLL